MRITENTHSSGNQPLISVITVVYNNQAEIEKTVESVINQTYKHIEYIIIDGGSTDGTLEKISKYKEYIHCIISEPDKGIYNAMNKGIIKANGKWINFMNGGDCFYHKDTVKEFVGKTLSNPGYQIFYGNYIWKKEEKENFIKAQHRMKTGYTMPTCHQAFFIDAGLHKKNVYNENYKMAADYDFMLKMYRSGIKFLKMPLTIAVYQGGGISERSAECKKEEYRVIHTTHNTTWQYFWIRNLYSKRIFDSGWRNYYLQCFLKRLLGKNIFHTLSVWKKRNNRN